MGRRQGGNLRSYAIASRREDKRFDLMRKKSPEVQGRLSPARSFWCMSGEKAELLVEH